jgi:dihydroorotate dehydrogenase
VKGLRHAEETGGLSGAPLRDVSTAVVRKLAQLLDGRVPIIGVGGVMSAADARAKLEAGASLVQIYTGFIYRGPELIGEILREFAAAKP